MNIPNIPARFRNAVDGFLKTNNTMSAPGDASHFLKYGNRRALMEDWSQVKMSDQETYTGYPYAAINNRANSVVELAENNLKTDATPSEIKIAKAKEEVVTHPYLTLIQDSDDFADTDFWYDISTYLDLEGVYYILVIRTVAEGRVGNVQEFKLLNPYEVRRIRNKDTGAIGGYIESRDGMIREIPPEMIIDIRALNPFSRDTPFSMTDASKENQFTLKQAGDYTRHSLKNNMAAPGIISTDILLEPEMFKNFVSRVTNQEKGLPLFGNGAGAINWDAMQIDLDKAGLKDINEINRSALFAVSGVGKTLMAIEESGTTRETAKIQKDLFTELHIIPQMRRIVNALNQDYKKYYKDQYKKNRYKITIDNPLGTDRDAELKDIEIRDSQLELYDKLVAMGYTRDLASKFAAGDITLEELGDPTEEPRPNPIIEAAQLKAGETPQNDNVEPPAAKKEEQQVIKYELDIDSSKLAEVIEEALEERIAAHKHDELHDHDHIPASVTNAFDEEAQGLIQQQQGALQNTVENIESRVTAAVLNKVTGNKFDDQDEIISDSDRRDFENELELAIAAFYGILVPLYARNTMERRAAEFGSLGSFKLNVTVKTYIKENAEKASKSHINTILDDLLKTIKASYDEMVAKELTAIEASGEASGEAAIKLAQKKALEGSSQQEIVSDIKKKYKDITANRAKAIARTETNRAFTQSQFQADLQFIKQNGYEGKAYKKWITRSSNPCQYCLDLAASPPIPFKENFADLGDTLSYTMEKDGKTKVYKLPINYEALSAGNAHVNCACRYQLIIEQ